jgi:prevent-host-death family protein
MPTQVSSYEAKTKLAELLRRVEAGEIITITRHGVPVATLGPARVIDRAKVHQAVADIRAMRKKLNLKMSAEEIKALIHEGHKY